ncbi:MAG: hypothetical protein ACYDB8_06100 [Acidiferrobacterales bacterium]
MSGALLQALRCNPLADPCVPGIPGSAAAATPGSMLLGLGSTWLGNNPKFGSRSHRAWTTDIDL